MTSGMSNPITKIRYYPRPGYESAMQNGNFEAFNIWPAEVTVIAKVETGDGRSVRYEYTPMQDPAMPATIYQMLSAANYGDGTRAEYSYAQLLNVTPPVMVRAVNPRLGGAATNIEFEYYNLGAYGAVGQLFREKNGVNGVEITRAASAGPNETGVWSAHGGLVKYKHYPDWKGQPAWKLDALGRKTEYTYEQGNMGFLKTVKDPLGRVTSWDRTLRGGVLTNTLPDGAKIVWTRDALDRVLTHTDELGRVTTYTRDGQGRVTRVDYPDGSFEQWTYNSFSQPLTHRQKNGGIESWTYDARGLKQSHTDALGHSTLYSYDAADRLHCVQDARGNVTTSIYNERGLITSIQNADGSSRSFTYDAFGNKLTETDELGHVTSWTYDEFNRMLTQTDPLGHVTTHVYGISGGGGGGCGPCGGVSGNNPIAIISPSGKVTEFFYDLEWQKTKQIVGAGRPDTCSSTLSVRNIPRRRNIILTLTLCCP
jgi:YD repeat-containing protein